MNRVQPVHRAPVRRRDLHPLCFERRKRDARPVAVHRPPVPRLQEGVRREQVHLAYIAESNEQEGGRLELVERAHRLHLVRLDVLERKTLAFRLLGFEENTFATGECPEVVQSVGFGVDGLDDLACLPANRLYTRLTLEHERLTLQLVHMIRLLDHLLELLTCCL